MFEPLDPAPLRVLGALIEKQFETPAYYPLTLNALIAACNQKSKREPVVEYREEEVSQALVRLRERGLVGRQLGDGNRAPKYLQRLVESLGLTHDQLAALAVLMLRGPQTLGEIRGRTTRMFDFHDLESVEQTLQGLAAHESGALVRELPRRPGTKETRWIHLLGGAPREALEDAAPEVPTRDEETGLEALRNEVQTLREQLESLRSDFETLRESLEG